MRGESRRNFGGQGGIGWPRLLYWMAAQHAESACHPVSQSAREYREAESPKSNSAAASMASKWAAGAEGGLKEVDSPKP